MKTIILHKTRKLLFLIGVFILSFSVKAQIATVNCIPTNIATWESSFYISTFSLDGESGANEINNTSTYDATRISNNTSQSAELLIGNTYNFSVENTKLTWGDVAVRLWIDYDNDGTFVVVYDSGGFTNNNNSSMTFSGSITIDPLAISGPVVLRVGAVYHSTDGSDFPATACGDYNNSRGEVEDYTVNLTSGTTEPEINLVGNNANIGNGKTTISTTDDTDYGYVDVGTGSVAHTFTIENNGTLDLTLDGNPYVEITGDTTDFTVTTTPISPVTASTNTTFTVTFDPTALGIRSATVSIANNDADENPYTFNIGGVGEDPYCTPTVGAEGSTGHYISNVDLSVDGGALLMSNSSGDNGYTDYSPTTSATLTQGESYTITTSFITGISNVASTVWIDYNQDGDFEDAGEQIGTQISYSSSGDMILNFTVSPSTPLGATKMRVGFGVYGVSSSCGGGWWDKEFEDYEIIITRDLNTPEINVLGNGTSIPNRKVTTSTIDNTDFGSVDMEFDSKVHSFTVENIGAVDLTVSTPVISGANEGDFTISANPTSPVSASSSTTFSITFNPSALGIRSAIVSIPNNDSDESPYLFIIKGEGTVDLPCSSDSVRILYSNDFGSQLLDPGTPSVPSPYTNYDYVEVYTGTVPVDDNGSIQDGRYTIFNNIQETAYWADGLWQTIGDHTDGGSSPTAGRMVIVNASEVNTGDKFFQKELSSIERGLPIEVSFWAMNLDISEASAGRTKPNIKITIVQNGVTYDVFTTGGLESAPEGDTSAWVKYSGTFIPETSDNITVAGIEIAGGGSGSDLAIDDILITQVDYCGLDTVETFGPNREWKYLDDGSNQGTAWSNTYYNDTSWATGDSELGYGDSDENTIVSYGGDANNKHTTTYFRKSFIVSAEDLEYSTLVMNAIRDDGMVVYLNGTKVWSDNMPETFDSSTFSLNESYDENDWISKSIENNLVEGVNIIAVEIHQRSLTSSDISFNMSLELKNYIVNADEDWKYLDDGSNQGTTWSGTSYDDASWAEGPAELGYGDGDENTVVSYGENPYNKHITTYFRKSFEASAAEAAFSTLVMNAIRDDGMVVYINGTQVWSDNMPASFNYNTKASGEVSNESSWISKSIDNLLVEGTNVIAVEIHQRNKWNPDISFNFSLELNNDLISSGGEWSYLDDGSDQGNAWYNTGFDYSSWAMGNAELGYGDGDENTTINYGGDEDNKHTTTYFKKSFEATASDVSASTITLNAVRDDGMVVYINGVEVWRDNITGTVDSTTLADAVVENSDESNWITTKIPNVLVLGTNEISVEIHQANLTSSDISFDFSLYVNNDSYIPDTDGDGVPDNLDYDDDNDGILDLVEQNGDVNRDTDGDGIPNHLDLDSDNDGIFDVIEYDGFGDLDIDGDGVADGEDLNGNGIVDTHTSFPDPIDTDNDGTPDYLDLDSDNDGIFDIDTTIYGTLIAHTNGKIDGNIDVDSDGIPDVLDTDIGTFGTYKNIDGSFALSFDGRNDYIEEASVIDGWSDATIMAWIYIDSNSSGRRRIAGQKKMHIKLMGNGSVKAVVAGTKIESPTALPTDIWVHVASSYNSNDGTVILYINGEEVASGSRSGNLPTDTSSLTIGRTSDVDDHYFKGMIDEVRIFEAGLTTEEIQKMVYQELDETTNFNSGKIIPEEISSTLGSSLRRYFKMDSFEDGIVDDKTTTGIDVTGAKMYNIKNIQHQTAPLPYVTAADGDWSDEATWKHGDKWDITTKANDENDFSIVHIKSNVTTSSTQGTAGLIVDKDNEFSVLNDQGLFNSWYLELDGVLDLEGESQLIQTENSVLAESSEGHIEKDQQGTANSYTFNYWSSPVSKIGVGSNNTPFTLADILRDGSDPSNPKALNFGASAYFADGGLTNPRKISTYWLYKFVNNGINYANWEWLGEFNSLNVTEGFTMKGTSSSSAVLDEQNYVFVGKPNNAPNNGELVHTNFAANDGVNANTSLTGNPFPSAIDADKFIEDNLIDGTNSITGTLYFWRHWAGGSHNSGDYEGGYATYTLAGGVSAGAPTESEEKIPGQYIPVGQGFYVTASETGGDVVFKNSQRVFEIEANNSESTFARGSASSSQQSSQTTTSSETQRIRLGFDTSDGFHRQIMVAYIEGTTDGYDAGYDGYAAGHLSTDAQFIQDDINYVIQSFGEFDIEREIPLDVFIDASEDGKTQKFTIDELENVPEEVSIFIKDNQTNILHDLRASDFEFQLVAGEHKTKFSLTFQDQVLSVPEDKLPISKELVVYMNNPSSEIQIQNNNNIEINKVTLYNSLGQQISTWNKNLKNQKTNLPVDSLSVGVYIVSLDTDEGNISKKVIIK